MTASAAVGCKPLLGIAGGSPRDVVLRELGDVPASTLQEASTTHEVVE
jgi:hypothetical protein